MRHGTTYDVYAMFFGIELVRSSGTAMISALGVASNCCSKEILALE